MGIGCQKRAMECYSSKKICNCECKGYEYLYAQEEKCKEKKCNHKKNCGNKKQCSKKCKCSDCKERNECNEFKIMANEKCQQAEICTNKSNRIAQQAQAAEKNAECLKQQAIDECKRANELWAEYNRLAKQGICLMEEAQVYLAKSAECYAELYEDVEGCNLEEFECHKHECHKHECHKHECHEHNHGGCGCC